MIQVDDAVLTPSDFTVEIWNIGKNTTKKDLETLCNKMLVRSDPDRYKKGVNYVHDVNLCLNYSKSLLPTKRITDDAYNLKYYRTKRYKKAMKNNDEVTKEQIDSNEDLYQDKETMKLYQKLYDTYVEVSTELKETINDHNEVIFAYVTFKHERKAYDALSV